MSRLLFIFAQPILGPVWRILRVIHLWKLRLKYANRYKITIYTPGNGIHYKWIFCNESSKDRFLVKTTSDFIEWWHRSVSQFKKMNNLPIDYQNLDFERIAKDIQYFMSIPELDEISPIARVDVPNREIWYRFMVDKKPIDLNNSLHLDMLRNVRKTLEEHGLRHGDDSLDNYILYKCASSSIEKIYMIDLESITRIRDKN